MSSLGGILSAVSTLTSPPAFGLSSNEEAFRMFTLADRLGDLRVRDLWSFTTPEMALERLGVVVRWSRYTTLGARAVDCIVEDDQGLWYALRLNLINPTGSVYSWSNPNARLLILQEAFAAEGAAVEPSLELLVHAISRRTEPIPKRLARSGDAWATGVHLSAALNLLPVDQRAPHATVLALVNPSLVAGMHRLENWTANIQMQDYWTPLVDAWSEAIAALWPSLVTVEPNAAVEPEEFESLMELPRDNWVREAKRALMSAAQDSDSRLFWWLRAEWTATHGLAEPTPEEFAAILPSITATHQPSS